MKIQLKILAILIGVFFLSGLLAKTTQAAARLWDIQSIDTMKYSRDTARKGYKVGELIKIIDEQMKNIAEIGATYVTIGTPYDDEFLPFLKKWAEGARKYGFKVWFRGNFSGWEGWFGYKKISRDEHRQKLTSFILNNPSLFENGDIFDPCPECENGGPGDPRNNGDLVAHRKFLIDETTMMKDAFNKIGKNVQTYIHSMNGDVLRLVMDKETTAALGGVATVDHYVKTPDKLNSDVEQMAEISGGKVMLGEFGVPIPDINGHFSETQQADWIEKALTGLSGLDKVAGINYWVNQGGSTAIWNDDGTPKKAVAVIKSFFSPQQLSIKAQDPAGRPIDGAMIRIGDGSRLFTTANGGTVVLPYRNLPMTLFVLAENYDGRKVVVQSPETLTINLEPQHKDMIVLSSEAVSGIVGFFVNKLGEIRKWLR